MHVSKIRPARGRHPVLDTQKHTDYTEIPLNSEKSMAKKSPEMQLFLLQQAANAAKEAERAERIALAKRKMDLEEEKVRLRAARIAALSADTERKAAKKPVRKLTVAEKEDARIAEQTRLFIAANPHLAPMPYETPPDTLNPDDRDLTARTEQIVANQEKRAADIEAARRAWNAQQHAEWLAAQTNPDPEDDTPLPPKPPKPPLDETGAEDDDLEPTP